MRQERWRGQLEGQLGRVLGDFLWQMMQGWVVRVCGYEGLVEVVQLL